MEVSIDGELFYITPRVLTQETPREVDFSFLRHLKPTVVFSTYWRFAVERQEIYFRRLRGEAQPWTNDLVLQTNKFTNAYRAADRVSQYLIRHVIGDESRSHQDTFFRILLFKLFNKIETWEFLTAEFGELCLASFNVDRFCNALNKAFANGRTLYSAAYIMPSGGRNGFARKHEMHLNLLKSMIQLNLPEKITDAKKMSTAFELLRACPTIGDFLAYQYVTDLNYSDVTDFQESEFVIPGPGAKAGLAKCFKSFGGLSESDVIRLVAENQEACLQALDLRFPTLWGRRLQLIDCQNLFCEVDKYARVAHPEFCAGGRTRIKQKLRPSSVALKPLFPKKWGLNGLLMEAPLYVPCS
jgi:hypothetical protein